MIVTEYVPFRDYTHTTLRDAVWEPVQSHHAMMWNDSMIEIKTHVGLDQGSP